MVWLMPLASTVPGETLGAGGGSAGGGGAGAAGTGGGAAVGGLSGAGSLGGGATVSSVAGGTVSPRVIGEVRPGSGPGARRDVEVRLGCAVPELIVGLSVTTRGDDVLVPLTSLATGSVWMTVSVDGISATVGDGSCGE